MKKNKETFKHNNGIDLFRIVSMLMIVLLHILGNGGVLTATAMSLHSALPWLLEISAYCAVDSYALISGYVGYGKERKYSNLLYLYFQVIFYTVITTTVFFVYKPEVINVKIIIKAIFPFAFNSGSYWYFSAYFCLFFFMPFFDIILDKLDKIMAGKLIICMFLVFSLLPTMFFSDFSGVNQGYSMLWLSVMYITGAYIKKYEFTIFKNDNKRLLGGYFVCALLTWGSKIVIEFITYKMFGQVKAAHYLVQYNSPTIICCSFFLLLFFANLNCGKRLTQFIHFFAPASFGVYLFHEEYLISENVLKGAFSGYQDFSSVFMLFAIIVTVVAVWVMGSIVDRVRLMIFDRLRVRQFCMCIENKVLSIF